MHLSWTSLLFAQLSSINDSRGGRDIQSLQPRALKVYPVYPLWAASSHRHQYLPHRGWCAYLDTSEAFVLGRFYDRAEKWGDCWVTWKPCRRSRPLSKLLVRRVQPWLWQGTRTCRLGLWCRCRWASCGGWCTTESTSDARRWILAFALVMVKPIL